MTKPVDMQSLELLREKLGGDGVAVLERLFLALEERITDTQITQDAIGLGDPAVSNLVGKLGARYVTVTAKNTEDMWMPKPYPYDTGEKAIYYFDGNCNDSTANGFDGVMADPGSVGDGYGGSMPFCGEAFYREDNAGDYNVMVVDSLSAGDLDGWGNFTIELYFRMYDSPPSNSGILIRKSGTSTDWGTNPPYFLRVTNGHFSTAQVYGEANIEDSLSGSHNLTVDCIPSAENMGPFTDGDWFHVAMCLAISETSATLYGYGRNIESTTTLTQYDTDSATVNTGSVLYENTNPLSIGARVKNSNYATQTSAISGQFHGLIDNVRIRSGAYYTGASYSIDNRDGAPQQVAHGLGRTPVVVLPLGEGDDIWRFDSQGGSSYKVVRRDDTYLHLRWDSDAVGKTFTFMVW